MINEALINNSIEFFAVDWKLHFTQNGITNSFSSSSPKDVINLLSNELDHDIKADKTIPFYLPRIKRLEIFGVCRYGDFNKVADFSQNNKDDTEYFQCGKRGQCPYEGIRCKQIVAPNGVLTKREIEIIGLIAQDKSDKEIASYLERSPNTIAVHRQHILLKLGANSKAGIAAFAAQRNLI